MGHFYFARHGQTVWNVENKICGATDIELTELGHQQAEELEQVLQRSKNVKGIVADPLYRPVCPENVAFYELPHIAFSGRIYKKKLPVLAELI